MAQEKRVALVTGANKGIGREVARQLAAAGLKVYVGARRLDAGEEAAQAIRDAGGDAEAIALDLNDRATIQAAAAAIDAAHGRLDVLVNNAGIGAPGDGPVETANLDAVRTVFETNYFGTLAVTQTMLPLVRKSAAGRIVNVSSGLGSIAENGDPDSPYAAVKLAGYNASKAALNMATAQLAHTLRDAGILVNAVDPGYTATDLNGHSGPQTIEEGSAETVRVALTATHTGGFTNTAGAVRW